MKRKNDLTPMLSHLMQDVSEIKARIGGLESAINRVENIEVGSVKITQETQRELIGFLSERVAYLMRQGKPND